MRVGLKMPGKSTQESSARDGAEPRAISRRRLLTTGIGGAGLVGAVAAISVSLDASRRAFAEEPQPPRGHAHHLMPTVVGEVDHAKNGFNPTGILTDFDPGKVNSLTCLTGFDRRRTRHCGCLGRRSGLLPATIGIVPGDRRGCRLPGCL